MGYFGDAISGFKWMGAFRGITRLGAFIRIAILARILTPKQFGVFGIASLMLVFLETITQTGINVFLIQERKKLDEYVNTAWVISIFRGFFIALALFTISPAISDFFNSPDSLLLLRLISVVALIRGFINPARVSFMKDLQFKKEFWFSIAIFLVDSTVAIAVSVIMGSPIGLVWGLIAGAVVEVFLSYILIKPRPKFSLEKPKAKDILSKGKWVTGSAIFDYFYEQGDDMAVGKIMDTYSLGIYQQAYKLSTLPLTEVTKVFNRFTFPVYSNISDDSKRLAKAFRKTSVVILLMTLPIAAALYIFANQIVLIVLGRSWMEVVPVLRVLAIFGVVRAFTVSTYPLFNSLKKQKYVAIISLSQFVLMALTIISLISYKGAVGAGLSVLIASLLTIPLLIYLLNNSLKQPVQAA